MSMPDSFEVMRTRRRVFNAGHQPGPPFRSDSWEPVRLPGYQPDEIGRIAAAVRRRVAKWRKARNRERA